MKQPPAEEWQFQAELDLQAAALLLSSANSSLYCQVIAKYQQAVEKTVKALATQLGVSIGYRHEVDSLLQSIRRLRAARTRSKHLAEIDSVIVRFEYDIRGLNRLSPARPAPGEPHRRNTEYPFEDAQGRWIAPARDGVFTVEDAYRYREVAKRVTLEVARTLTILRRVPPKR